MQELSPETNGQFTEMTTTEIGHNSWIESSKTNIPIKQLINIFLVDGTC